MEFLSEESSIVHFRLVRISTKGNEWKKPVCEDLVPKITSEDHPSFILQPAMLAVDAFIDSTFYRTPCQCWTVVSCSNIFITCEPSLSIRTNEKKIQTAVGLSANRKPLTIGIVTGLFIIGVIWHCNKANECVTCTACRWTCWRMKERKID